jgi:hypothetical protein
VKLEGDNINPKSNGGPGGSVVGGGPVGVVGGGIVKVREGFIVKVMVGNIPVKEGRKVVVGGIVKVIVPGIVKVIVPGNVISASRNGLAKGACTFNTLSLSIAALDKNMSNKTIPRMAFLTFI